MHNVEWYLSKGLSTPMAEYLASGRKKIIKIVPNTDFTLTLTFDNSECRLLDVKPFLKKNTVFEPFIEYENFKRVYLDENNTVCWDIDPNINSSVVWRNKVDLCPDSCYVDSIRIS